MKVAGDIHYAHVPWEDDPTKGEVRRCIYIGEEQDDSGSIVHVVVPGYKRPDKMGRVPFHIIPTTYTVLPGVSCPRLKQFERNTHLYQESIQAIPNHYLRECVGRLDGDRFYDDILPAVLKWADSRANS